MSEYVTIKLKSGSSDNLKNIELAAGEPIYLTDKKNLLIATGEKDQDGNHIFFDINDSINTTAIKSRKEAIKYGIIF